MARIYVAGTFDHLHAGHKTLLTRAFSLGGDIMIGLTSDRYINTYKKTAQVASYDIRKQQLLNWLGSREGFTIVPIDDPYEPALSDPNGGTMLVTQDTRGRAEELNAMRERNRLAPFTLVDVPMVSAEDEKPIASSRIRAGEIDADGRLIMPHTLREQLSKPLGEIRVGDAIGTSIETHRQDIMISVGDMTAKTLFTAGVVPHLIIVDYHVERKPFADNDEMFLTLPLYKKSFVSGPGYIAHEVIEIIKKWSHHPSEKMIVSISGEEDLLTIPAVAYGPIGAVVYYGQPGVGMVEVVITPEKQQEAIALLGLFSVQ